MHTSKLLFSVLGIRSLQKAANTRVVGRIRSGDNFVALF